MYLASRPFPIDPGRADLEEDGAPSGAPRDGGEHHDGHAPPTATMPLPAVERMKNRSLSIRADGFSAPWHLHVR